MPNIDSQIQGDGNAVVVTAQQAFPSVIPELQTCEECFSDFLTADEIALFELVITRLTEGDISSIGELCTLLEGLQGAEQQEVIDAIAFILAAIEIDESTIVEIMDCLERVLV